jgi:hypothetical protein
MPPPWNSCAELMSRRFVSAVLLVGYCSLQVASLPHAHADSRADHDARPHFHWGWFVQPSSEDGQPTRERIHHHGHSHKGGHDHHVHERRPAEPSESPSNTDPDATSVHIPASDHDFKRSTEPNEFVQWTSVPLAVFTEALTVPALAFCAPPIEHSGGGCALILKLRTLRI